MNTTPHLAPRTGTLALALVALVGMAGCEMAPGTYTTMGTGPNQPQRQEAGQPVRGTAATPVRYDAPSAQVSAQPRNAAGTISIDPISTSLVGGPAASDSVMRLHAQPLPAGQPSNAALNLYGEVLARSMTPQGAETSKIGGANLKQVSFALEGADFDPDISRDGRRIVYSSTQHRFTADIYVKNVDSRVVSQLTNDPANDVMPKISPDGTRVAFASNRAGNWDIFVMPINGGRAIQLTNNSADDLHPTWSPDGSRIAFCRLGEVSNQWEIWTTEVGNSGVASFVCYGLFPDWCPVPGSGANGADKIAFQKSRERGDRAFSIWTVDYRDGQADNLTEIASSPIAACINPAWSLDGQWLAFATVPNPQQWAQSTDSRPSSADLWITDVNGNSRISLSAGSAVNLMPAWGPSNRLFFVSDRGGIDNIWSMDTTQIVQLAALNMKSSTAYTATPVATPAANPVSPRTPAGSRITTGQEAAQPGEHR